MARKYTILILPHARARFRKLHLSSGFLFAVAAALVLLMVAGLVVPHLSFQVWSQSERLVALQAENRELRDERETFESSVAELTEQLGRYEAHARLLAAELGVDKLASDRPAAGGSLDGLPVSPTPGGAPFGEEFEALRARAGVLDRSFEQLDDAWQERERRLASTPSVMPARGWFSHGFGWRKDPFTGQRAFHRGIDIVAPDGSPVTAPADGVVTAAGRLGPYGKRIDLSHGFGYVTRYGHLSEILVRPGQRVRRGDRIGRVGSTGRSTGPHLHYEIFRDGRRVNPWRYLGEKRF